MNRYSANSLKRTIRLATGALAFFVFSFGIGSYLLVSLFSENSFYAASIRFMLVAAMIVIYGWWLSSEAIKPIEKLSLLAKSLERGVSISLPKTSGSSETDELLQTLHRNNQQMQNLLRMMEKVSSGNLAVVLAPLEQNDRLSVSFQKLLAKVTESINAKRELDRIQSGIRHLTEQINLVRNGQLDIEIGADFGQTTEISETLKALFQQFDGLINQVQTDSKQTHDCAQEMRKIIHTIIGADENRARELNQATVTLKQIPQSVQKITEELFASSHSARQSIAKARVGTEKAQENVTVVNAIRQQIRESVKRIGRLGERTQEIGKIAKTVEDLAQRTNMIALNASIQAVETNGQGRMIAAFTEEVERLAERAAKTNRQISTLNKTITAELGEIERSLQESVSEAAKLSQFAIETGSSISELEKYINQFLNLQEKLVATASIQSSEAEAAFQSFVASIAETENSVKNLKESEIQIVRIETVMQNLQNAVEGYKTSPPVSETAPAQAFLTDFNPEYPT